MMISRKRLGVSSSSVSRMIKVRSNAALRALGTTATAATTTTTTSRRWQSTATVTSSTSPSAAADIPPLTSTSSSPTTKSRKYEFFQNVEITGSGVAVIKFDGPKAVNTISFKLSEEAKVLWKNEIETNPAVKAVVFTSGKPGNFIAGADIFDIQAIENKQDLIPLIADELAFFQHVRAKGVPLVAAIDGPALGGGLEWALWCDYRICTDSDKTKLGLPEVKLGLLPGFGGTQNLHPVVGLQNAMDMMLTGKDIRAHKAKSMGLVDLVVASQSLEAVAISSAEQLASGQLKVTRKPKSIFNRILEDNSIGQSIIWNQIDKMVKKNTDGNYPAPYAIIECVKHGLANPADKYKFEREQFAKLAATPESEALIGIFDGMTSMKKHQYGNVSIPVHTVTVLGAGLMGAGIAQVTAEKGYRVNLKDRNDEAVGRGISYMTDNWQKKVSRKHMTEFQRNRNTSSVIPLTDETPSVAKHLAKTDLIIEAVFENLELKQQIVADMEAACSEKTIFATNTSAIPIARIAEKAKRPENIIGACVLVCSCLVVCFLKDHPFSSVIGITYSHFG